MNRGRYHGRRAVVAVDGRMTIIKLALQAVGNRAIIGMKVSDQSNLRTDKHRQQQGRQHLERAKLVEVVVHSGRKGTLFSVSRKEPEIRFARFCVPRYGRHT